MLTTRSVSAMRGIGRLTEALHSDKNDKAEDIAEAKRFSELAEKECKAGFPLTMSHAAVSLWAALEATVPRFTVMWMLKYPDILRSEPFHSIRLAVADFEALDRDDLLTLVVEQLERTTSAPLKFGVGRFEALLDAIGLGGGVEEPLRRDLFELSQVRNLVVHRFGVVDRRFQNACPWLEAQRGHRQKIAFEDFLRYRGAIGNYGAEIVDRAEQREKELENKE